MKQYEILIGSGEGYYITFDVKLISINDDKATVEFIDDDEDFAWDKGEIIEDLEFLPKDHFVRYDELFIREKE